VTLTVVGSVLVLAAAVLQWVISSYHSTTVVTKAGDTTTTVTGPSAPPATLVTTCLAAGIICILAGAFFSRISKVVVTGIGEVDLETQSALAGEVAKKAKGNPEMARKIYRKAAPQVAQKLAVRVIAGASGEAAPVTPNFAPQSIQVGLSDAELTDIVDEAAKE
jgi:hypothetical protein